MGLKYLLLLVVRCHRRCMASRCVVDEVFNNGDDGSVSAGVVAVAC